MLIFHNLWPKSRIRRWYICALLSLEATWEWSIFGAHLGTRARRLIQPSLRRELICSPPAWIIYLKRETAQASCFWSPPPSPAPRHPLPSRLPSHVSPFTSSSFLLIPLMFLLEIPKKQKWMSCFFSEISPILTKTDGASGKILQRWRLRVTLMHFVHGHIRVRTHIMEREY